MGLVCISYEIYLLKETKVKTYRGGDLKLSYEINRISTSS